MSLSCLAPQTTLVLFFYRVKFSTATKKKFATVVVFLCIRVYFILLNRLLRKSRRRQKKLFILCVCVCIGFLFYCNALITRRINFLLYINICTVNIAYTTKCIEIENPERAVHVRACKIVSNFKNKLLLLFLDCEAECAFAHVHGQADIHTHTVKMSLSVL